MRHCNVLAHHEAAMGCTNRGMVSVFKLVCVTSVHVLMHERGGGRGTGRRGHRRGADLLQDGQVVARSWLTHRLNHCACETVPRLPGCPTADCQHLHSSHSECSAAAQVKRCGCYFAETISSAPVLLVVDVATLHTSFE